MVVGEVDIGLLPDRLQCGDAPPATTERSGDLVDAGNALVLDLLRPRDVAEQRDVTNPARETLRPPL